MIPVENKTPCWRAPARSRIVGLAALVLASTTVPVVASAPVGAAAAPATTSIASGSWSDPAVWAGRRVPAPGRAVTIAAGDHVVVGSDVSVAGIVVDGNLELDPARSVTVLSSRNVIVNGSFEMRPGSAALVHRLRFVGVDDSKFVGGGTSPLPSDVGLWVVGAGRLDLEGTPKTAWLHLAGALDAGQSGGIGLDAAPVGWQPGDEVFVAPTQPPTAAVGTATWSGFDTSTIAGVSGSTLALTTPARRPHPVVDGRWTAEVGDLTRNVKIEGTATGYSHVFVHSTRPQTIRFVELTYMGNDRVIGRYPLHFHHDGDGSRGSVIDGVVIHRSANHAFVPHASNGISFTDTIAFDVAHTAYWWDQDTVASRGNGSSGVLFDHALAADVHTRAGIRLAGFRLGQGPAGSNTVRDSVAVGVQGGNQSAGFQWATGGASDWNFTDNLTHNDKVLGILVWKNGGTQRIDGFTDYYSATGILHGAYKNEYHYRHVTLYGERNTGLTLYATAKATGIGFDDLHIDGAGITQLGIFSCCHRLLGARYPTTISNCSVDHTVYGSIWEGTGRRGPDALRVVDCALGDQPFHFQSGTPAAGSIEVTTPTDHYRLTPVATGPTSTYDAAWNAWITRLP